MQARRPVRRGHRPFAFQGWAKGSGAEVLGGNLWPVRATPRVARASSALSWWLALLRRHNGMAGAAAVARPTTGWMVFSKVAADEQASAFGRLGVVGHQPKTPLALKPKSLELRNELTHARSELVRRHDDGDAAVRIALNETGLFEIGQQHFADPGGYTGGVGERLRRWRALLARPGGERGLKPFEMTDAGAAQRLKVLLDFKVGRVKQEDALRGLPSRCRASPSRK